MTGIQVKGQTSKQLLVGVCILTCEHIHKMQMEEKNKILSAWLNDRLRYNDVPRMTEITQYVRDREKIDKDLKWTRKDIRQILENHPTFKMNLRQQRKAGRWRMYRPVIVSNLGHWHADIGYFSVNKRYQTPVSYRAGFLVAKDVLSRYVYATPLVKNKSAEYDSSVQSVV